MPKITSAIDIADALGVSIFLVASMVLLFLGGVGYMTFEIFRCIREYKNDKNKKE